MTIRTSFRMLALAAALLVLLSAIQIQPVSAEPEPLEDGLYGIELLTYSHGTEKLSVMNDYIGNAAVLEVQGDNKTVHALVRSNNWIKELKIGATPGNLTDVEFLTPEQQVTGLTGTAGLVERTYAAISFPVDALGDYNYEVFTHVTLPDGLFPGGYDNVYDVHLRVSHPLNSQPIPATGGLEQLQGAIAAAEQVLIAGREHSTFNPERYADGYLQNTIAFAKAVQKLSGATPLQVATAHHYLTHDAAEFGALYPATGEAITIQGVHATNDYEASTMNSYLLYPNVITEDGVTKVRLTLRDHGSIPSFKVEQDGELVEATTLSVDHHANSRRVSFPIASLEDELDATVSISIGTYNQTREFRIIFNRPLNRTDLLAEVTAAQTLHDQAVTGTAAGQYPSAAKTALNTAITKAKTDGSMLSTQEKVDTAATELKAAITTFRNAVVAPGNGGGPVTPPPAGGLTDGKYMINVRFVKAGSSQTSVMDDYVASPGRMLVQNGNKTVMVNLKQSNEITSFSVGGAAVGVVETDSGANTRRVSFPVSDLNQILSGKVRIDWSEINYHFSYDVQIELGSPTKVDDWGPEHWKNAPVRPNPGDNPNQPNPNPNPNPNPPAAGGGGTSPAEEEEQGSESGNETPSQPGGSDGSNGGGNETSVTPTPSVEFTDTDTHWAYPSIARATQLGIINGYTDGTFKPNATVNRAEFAAIISRAFQLQLNAPSASFSDWNGVQNWAKPFIEQTVAAGIINGYEDGSFRPGQQVSRTEITVMIARALGLPTDEKAVLDFQDASQIPAYAKPYIAAAVQHGLIEGLGDNTFGVQAPATRAQAVTLILRALDYLAAAQPGQTA